MGASPEDLAHAADRLGHCGYLNASVCHPTVEMSRLGHDILVAVYNPLGWPRSEGVRVPINTSSSINWTVTGACHSQAALHIIPASETCTFAACAKREVPW